MGWTTLKIRLIVIICVRSSWFYSTMPMIICSDRLITQKRKQTDKLLEIMVPTLKALGMNFPIDYSDRKSPKEVIYYSHLEFAFSPCSRPDKFTVPIRYCLLLGSRSDRTSPLTFQCADYSGCAVCNDWITEIGSFRMLRDFYLRIARLLIPLRESQLLPKCTRTPLYMLIAVGQCWLTTEFE